MQGIYEGGAPDSLPITEGTDMGLCVKEEAGERACPPSHSPSKQC